jgi:hypothetical protein
MITRGILQSLTFGHYGPIVMVAGAKYYGDKTVQIADIKEGDTVELEYQEKMGKNGYNYRVFQGWCKASIQMPNTAPPATSGANPTTSGPLTVTSLGEGERAFVSNIVSHAITAGLVKDAADLGIWSIAAYKALQEVKDEAAGISSDDRIPF